MKFIITTAIAALVALATTAPAQTSRPATRPTTRPTAARPGPGDSGLEVVIKSAKVDFLMLRKVNAKGVNDELFSDDNLLVIRLEITNKGAKDIAYKTFNGTPNGAEDHAALLDANQKLAALVTFGDFEPKELTKAATLRPGDTITDVLAFSQPANGAKPATLILPARNHGDTGLWRLPVKLDPKDPLK